MGFSYVYISNLNWLLLSLYLQVDAGFIAPNIGWLEFLHKYHNYANKKHKVYLGGKKKETIVTMTYFYKIWEWEISSDLLVTFSFSSPNHSVKIL